MQYGKLENGELIIAQRNYTTESGATICNFNSSVEIMHQYGFKEIVRAERNPEKDYVVSWEETETQLIEILTERQKTPEEIQREIEEQERQFDEEFFNTSLGYVRRTVTMQNGTASFLKDLLPNYVPGIPVIVYDRPNFSGGVVNMVAYQHHETATNEFIQECKNQLIVDFYGYNPLAVQQPEEPTEPEESINE